MAVTPNTITTQDTIAAVFSEYISRYQQEFDRFEEMLGIFQPEVVQAGTSLFKYVVSGQLTDQAIDPGTIVYEKTKDTDVVSGKKYYTKSGSTYTEECEGSCDCGGGGSPPGCDPPSGSSPAA